MWLKAEDWGLLYNKQHASLLSRIELRRRVSLHETGEGLK